MLRSEIVTIRTTSFSLSSLLLFSSGNTPIRTGETWMTIAQYTSGGLFRWVSYGFRSAKSLLKTNTGKLLKEQIDKVAGERWKEGLAMFSTLEGLQAEVEGAFNTVEWP